MITHIMAQLVALEEVLNKKNSMNPCSFSLFKHDLAFRTLKTSVTIAYLQSVNVTIKQYSTRIVFMFRTSIFFCCGDWLISGRGLGLWLSFLLIVFVYTCCSFCFLGLVWCVFLCFQLLLCFASFHVALLLWVSGAYIAFRLTAADLSEVQRRKDRRSRATPPTR